MPRRKKEENMSLNERIELVDTQISEGKESLVSLKSQRKELENARDEEAMQNIYDFIKASDMTPTEFLSVLQEKAAGQEEL